MRNRLINFVGACLSAALLAACAGTNGLPSSTPLSAAPQMAPRPEAAAAGLPQSVRSQPAFDQYATQGLSRDDSTFGVLHRFRGGDGYFPTGDLTNVGGTLYGTTYGGIYKSESRDSYGTIFALSTSGKEQVLHKFVYSGETPNGGLTNINGTLYGTTVGGGTGTGSVFKISCYLAACKETNLYSFGAVRHDLVFPRAGLTNVNGTLYGTGYKGGTRDYGGVFKITTSGRYSLLYSFKVGKDGYPAASLTNIGGTLYGTTDTGTVFKISTSGEETLLQRYNPKEGAFQGPLTSVGRTLYGTTQDGGIYSAGTVFKMTTSGAETVLYSFRGLSDGWYPNGHLAYVDGVLYGTTVLGGISNCHDGCGTIFKVSTSGQGHVLYRFKGGRDGWDPNGGLTRVGGRLYGATLLGGIYNNVKCDDGDEGCGTVFSIGIRSKE